MEAPATTTREAHANDETSKQARKLKAMESVGELIEKLVIANIKLWMVKDAQTAIACREDPVLNEVKHHLTLLTRTDELGEKESYSIEDMTRMLEKLDDIAKSSASDLPKILKQLVVKDIELCEARAHYRRAINKSLGDTTAADTVKQYAHRG